MAPDKLALICSTLSATKKKKSKLAYCLDELLKKRFMLRSTFAKNQ